MGARQRGFTLIEVMVAVMVSAAVLAPAMAFFFATLEWREQANSQIRLNQQARAMFSLLQDGARQSANGVDETPNVYGLRGRQSAPASGLRTNNTLTLASNGGMVTSDTFAPVSVTCTAAGAPLPDCTSPGQTRTVAGYLGRDVTIDATSRSIAGRTAEVALTVTDPFEARRLENPARATETFRGIVTMNRERADP